MTPETPILMIGLQIPILPDTTVDQVMSAIAQKVSEALDEVRKQQETTDPEPLSQTEFNAWVVKEAQEAYTEQTENDMLAVLGYGSEA